MSINLSVTHTFEMTARCPVDGSWDSYTVIVTNDRQIDVERLLQVATGLVGVRIYQEAVAEAFVALDPSLVVEVIGSHSGVNTKVVAWTS